MAAVRVEIPVVDAGQTHELRQRILRPHQAVAEMVYHGDDDPETAHFAVLDGGGEAVGVVSLYRRPMPGEAAGGDWQFRGMAVDGRLHRRGVGRLLLTACFDHARANGGTRLWCNARLSAAGFYERLGFERRGDEFVVADIGPHVVMTARIAPLNCTP